MRALLRSQELTYRASGEHVNYDFLKNFTFECEDGVEVKGHGVHIAHMSGRLLATMNRLFAEGSEYRYNMREAPIQEGIPMSKIANLLVKVSEGAPPSLPEFDDPQLAAVFINVMDFFLFNYVASTVVLSRIMERYPSRFSGTPRAPYDSGKASEFAVAMFEVVDGEQRKRLLINKMNHEHTFDFGPFMNGALRKERVHEYVELLITHRDRMDCEFVRGLKHLIVSIEQGPSWRYFDVPLLVLSTLYTYNHRAIPCDCVDVFKNWIGHDFETIIARQCLEYMDDVIAADRVYGTRTYTLSDEYKNNTCFKKHGLQRFTFNSFAALVASVAPENIPVFSGPLVASFFSDAYDDRKVETFRKIIEGKLKDYGAHIEKEYPSVIWKLMDEFQKIRVEFAARLQLFVELILYECVRAAASSEIAVSAEEYLQNLSPDIDHLDKLKTVLNVKRNLEVPFPLTTRKRKRR